MAYSSSLSLFCSCSLPIIIIIAYYYNDWLTHPMGKVTQVVLKVVLIALLLVGATIAKENTEAIQKGSPTTFTAEVSKMLDILINSLYTNRAIFLRELISNGSDALDKVRVTYLTEPKDPRNDAGEAPTMDIHISVSPETKELIIRDGGVGMTKEELGTHLGSLGTSGTKRFLENLKASSTDNNNLIGQFGVGFYSVFLVGKNVRVASKSDADSKQYVWESSGNGQFFLYEDPRGNTLGRGTEIRIELKSDAVEYLKTDRVKKTIHQYSEFIDFPIYLEEAEKDNDQVQKEIEYGEDVENTTGNKTWTLVNKNKPIWTRPTSEVTEEEYDSFYKAVSSDWRTPMYYSHFHVEGEVEFDSILYIPEIINREEQATNDASMLNRNIKLYVRRVFITDEFKDLLPHYLNFVRGVVDSNDLPLNVSREVLQESRVLRVIKRKLVRKVLSMIADIQVQDDNLRKLKEENKTFEPAKGTGVRQLQVETYPKFWETYGRFLRYGLIVDPSNRGRITKLLRYKTSRSEDRYVGLQDYIDHMQKGQKAIYYLSGDSIAKIKTSPLLQDALKRNVEVIYMTDAVDEYVVAQVPDFSGKKLVNLAKEGLQFDEENSPEALNLEKKRNEKYAPLLDRLKRLFGKQVRKLVLTKRYTTEPFLLIADENHLTARMANILKSQSLGRGATEDVPLTAERVVEVNWRHPLVDEVYKRFLVDENDLVAEDIAWTLFDTANLQGDFPVVDTQAYAQRVTRLLSSSVDLDPTMGLLPDVDDDGLGDL
ncbi:heat shock protein 90kDa beta [Angomonas deanei]|nr:heat shock protein 90kDa beta [Angomonas deanei]|eukprot:EPY36667.1 heat shock protein 90kDa beta [Angomonas deanei]